MDFEEIELENFIAQYEYHAPMEGRNHKVFAVKSFLKRYPGIDWKDIVVFENSENPYQFCIVVHDQHCVISIGVSQC